MATKPKTDPLSLRRRVHRIIAKDIKAVEEFQRTSKGTQLDPKTATQMVAYAKALNEQLHEEEMFARKMLEEASKLTVAQLMERAGQAAPVGEENDDAEAEEAEPADD